MSSPGKTFIWLIKGTVELRKTNEFMGHLFIIGPSFQDKRNPKFASYQPQRILIDHEDMK